MKSGLLLGQSGSKTKDVYIHTGTTPKLNGIEKHALRVQVHFSMQEKPDITYTRNPDRNPTECTIGRLVVGQDNSWHKKATHDIDDR